MEWAKKLEEATPVLILRSLALGLCRHSQHEYRAIVAMAFLRLPSQEHLVDRGADLLGRHAHAPAENLTEPLLAEHVARSAGLGDAVGVEHDGIGGPKLEGLLGQVGGREETEKHAPVSYT